MVKTKLGLIAFANDGGLGAQTRRLAHMLKPDIIMVVDSSSFSRNPEQHFEWYKGFKYFVVSGFPTNADIKRFIEGLTHVICVENPYNFGLVHWAQQQGTKVYCQSNYEFCDNLDKPWLPIPDKFLMPSWWKVSEMKNKFGNDKVTYLPPPIDPEEFKVPREVNVNREGKKRFLHVIGTVAMHDRNGTLDLIDAIKKCKSDFELVIKSQHPLSMDVYVDDPRIIYEVDNVKDNSALYNDCDVLILPRRWGGLSLTMDEALMSAMPVIATDIEPNNEWLPKEWLVKSSVKGAFAARSPINYYSADLQELADKIDWFANMSDQDLLDHKAKAYELALKTFDPVNIKNDYLQLLNNR